MPEPCCSWTTLVVPFWNRITGHVHRLDALIAVLEDEDGGVDHRHRHRRVQ